MKLAPFFALLCSFFSFSQQEEIDTIGQSLSFSENFRSFLEASQEPSTISGTKFFDYHSGIKKAYLFNGDFQLPVTLGGKSYVTGKKRAWFHAIQFIPSAKVRIFQNDPKYQDKSKPVRTPSYYPKLNYYLTNERFWSQNAKYFAGIGIGHHSNGQDGTEFVDFTDTVNIYNGSFSESLIAYFSIGGNYRFELPYRKNKSCSESWNDLRKKSIRTSRKFKKHPYRINQQKSDFGNTLNFNWKLGFEYHPPYFSNQKFHQSGVYGGNRIYASFQFVKLIHYFIDNSFTPKEIFKNLNYGFLRENHRLHLNVEYITDLTYFSGGYNHLEKIKLTDASKRLNINLTYYKRFLASKYPALFLQAGYYGSDNYNIYFQKSFFQARIGLAFGFFIYDEAKTISKRASK